MRNAGFVIPFVFKRRKIVNQREKSFSRMLTALPGFTIGLKYAYLTDGQGASRDIKKSLMACGEANRRSGALEIGNPELPTRIDRILLAGDVLHSYFFRLSRCRLSPVFSLFVSFSGSLALAALGLQISDTICRALW